LPPELLEDVEQYALSFWFRHSATSPIENPRWDDVYKRCLNLFRIRETEDGNQENLGDRSAMVMVCPNRDTGALSIRAATYDIESANANLYVDEQILFSEL